MTDAGFWIPHRYAEFVTAIPHYPELLPAFEATRDEQLELLQIASEFAPDLARFSGTKPPLPRWEQDWFPGLDGAIAYTMIRHQRPAGVLEVGSGHSTRFMVKAAQDADLKTEFTCIDPAPRADIASLDVDLILKPLQQISLESLPELQAGDVLFVDSSHLSLPGTDVDILFNRILPTLPAGVFVHIHDIFLPNRYPESWEWRGYGEHQVLGGWIATGGLKILHSSQYARTYLADQLPDFLQNIPVPEGAFETSLWTVKQSPAL